jgi:hypothetical protein
MRIYDARFKYTPALNTDVVTTWKRFGFKPTTEAERLARQRRSYPEDAVAVARASGAVVTQLDAAKRKIRLGEK